MFVCESLILINLDCLSDFNGLILFLLFEFDD